MSDMKHSVRMRLNWRFGAPCVLEEQESTLLQEQLIGNTWRLLGLNFAD
jgi:hypothetical protein